MKFFAWTVRWTFATIAVLAVMALSAFFVFNRAVEGGDYVVVPDVVGLPVTQAANLFAERGLDVGEQRQVISDRVPEYHVLLQRPAPNRVIRAGRKVSLTVSSGRESAPAPDLRGTTLEDALVKLDATRFALGTIARIPDPAPKDTILGQDPEPDVALSVGGEIQLLVSEGPDAQPFFMPDIRGRSLESAQRTLAELNLTAIPYKVNRQGADYEVILNQAPEPGTLIRPGDEVTFDVRVLPSTFLPNARRKVALEYVVPLVRPEPTIRVDVVDNANQRETVYPRPEHYRNGRPPTHAGGSTITLGQIVFSSEVTVEFYANDVLHTSFYFQGDNEPIETRNPAFVTSPSTRVNQEDLESVFRPSAPPTAPVSPIRGAPINRRPIQ